MTTLYYKSVSFIPETGQEKETGIIFNTDDDYPHYSDSSAPPFHIFRAGQEPVEFLARLLGRFLDNEFDDEFDLYETISPDILDRDYSQKEINGLNVSIFSKDGFNVVCTIVRRKV